MTSTGKEQYAQEESFDFSQYFYHLLSKSLQKQNLSERCKVLFDTIAKEKEAICFRCKELLSDQASVEHLELVALLTAIYRGLQRVLKLPADATLKILLQTFIHEQQAHISSFTRRALDQAEEPWRRIVSMSKDKEREFGETFAFERIVDNAYAYQVHCTKCFYYDLAKFLEVPELMEILCAWDWNWAAGIQPEKYGFCFERPTTIGYGSDVCRFYFYKKNS